MRLDWIDAAALTGLLAVAGPVVVHLLRRHRAPRVPFPTVQFLVSAPVAAARFRQPSDLALLALRVAIVAAAAAAAAQPVLVTGWRRTAWEQRVARAFVIDTSESMTPAASMLQHAVAAERQTSPGALEIRSSDLAASLRQAVRALDGADAGRAEIAVFSDFQQGSLTSAGVAAIPPGVGLRFVAIEAVPPAGSFTGLHVLGADGSSEQQITLDGPRTRVTLTGASPPRRAPAVLTSPDQADAVESMRRVVAAAGAPALPADRELTLIFPGGAVPRAEPPRVGWMRRALLAARSDDDLRAAAASHADASGPAVPPGWLPVARAASGRPLVGVAAVGQAFAGYVSAAPGDLVAAAALRALLFAVAKPAGWKEREVLRVPPSQLAAWTRQAEPRPVHEWTHQPPGDARWCWGLALLLLAVETVVRRSRSDVNQEQARAA